GKSQEALEPRAWEESTWDLAGGSSPTRLEHAQSRLPAFVLRKEVIQPQVPLRLPCYDFVPLTGHTFDASPPCGLGQRLRVQQTQVTLRAVCTRPGNVFTAV